MDADEHVENVKEKARELIAAMNEAEAAGVPPVSLLPELVTVFREAGMIPAGLPFG